MRQDGTSGDDILRTTSNIKDVRGHAGDDILYVEHSGGAAHGGLGNDTLYGGGEGGAQAHLYGGRGNDTIHMSASDRMAPYGSHSWGNEGRDKFIFTDVWKSSARSTGRIDDFDYTRDELWVENERIDLKSPPDYVRIVEYRGQPWILIDDRILYTLEGARQTLGPEYSPSEEVHFIDWPPEWIGGVPRSADITYEDFVDFFPADRLDLDEAKLNRVAGHNQADKLYGTSGDDYIWGADGADQVYGGGGRDLINGGEGYDTLFGGAGDDYLAGGLDQDVIYGGEGNDLAYGGSGRDAVYGGSGQDELHGNGENDLLDGGAGHDTLFGGRGDDVLIGGSGSDTLYGGSGDDVLIAGAVRRPDDEPEGIKPAPGPAEAAPEAHLALNVMDGGKGSDKLYAAAYEAHEMTGGLGRDSFISAQGAQIRIHDFVVGVDRLDISGLVDPETDIKSMFTSEARSDDSSIADLHLRLLDGGHIVLGGLGGANLADVVKSIVNNAEAPDPAEHVEQWHNAGAPNLGAPHRPHDDHPPHDKDDPKDDPKDADGEGGSCFVATASFGNAAHPDVTWLREFRDGVLLPHPIGRAFIRFYWLVGPVLAKFVRADNGSGAILRAVLARLVSFGRRNV